VSLSGEPTVDLVDYLRHRPGSGPDMLIGQRITGPALIEEGL
jgi:hypothetical protein